MFVLQHVGIMYGDRPNVVTDIATADTVHPLYEALRQKFLESNQRKIDLNETMDVPECILRLARRAIRKNPFMRFELYHYEDEGDIVFVDGYCPEMDYYRIAEI